MEQTNNASTVHNNASTVHSGEVSRSRRRSPHFSRDVSAFCSGVFGRYEFEAFGHRVRGRQVEETVKDRRGNRRSVNKFLLLEMKDTKSGEVLYNRPRVLSDGEEFLISVTVNSIRGFGPMEVPEFVTESDDVADIIRMTREVITAAVSHHSFMEHEEVVRQKAA